MRRQPFTFRINVAILQKLASQLGALVLMLPENVAPVPGLAHKFDTKIKYKHMAQRTYFTLPPELVIKLSESSVFIAVHITK